ncbi:hypothetical protein QJS10_CPB19g00040 [Acorus calamus]|uniref:Dirigent protein n=1 Tax=Acorus calamus TaxID=4465 RepID=A0AAV9CHE7_ACOCL|nr:hypothetical protein QJS10_CPB19g00040 [Acorus calamus]
MALTIPKSLSMTMLISIFCIITSLTRINARKHPDFNLGDEKKTHLRLYFHHVGSGPDPTAVQIASAQSSANSPTKFGIVLMIDEPLTVGPDIRSMPVGRAEGIYGSASKDEVALVMAFNIVFDQGTYNGSTLALLGRNCIYSTGAREMPVVGGTGKFRFARGYDLLKTYSFNTTSGDAVVEHNVFIVHY